MKICNFSTASYVAMGQGGLFGRTISDRSVVCNLISDLRFLHGHMEVNVGLESKCKLRMCQGLSALNGVDRFVSSRCLGRFGSCEI